jgi:hypothetical protein
LSTPDDGPVPPEISPRNATGDAVAERVAAGAAFLDEHEWWRTDVENAIDLDALHLSSADRCILGQRCPVPVLAAFIGADPAASDDWDTVDWNQAYRACATDLHGEFLTLGTLHAWAASCGFNANDGSEWKPLHREWTRVITERRAAAGVPA